MSQNENFTVQKILDCRGQFSSREYLVQWKGFTIQESSWEPLTSLKNCDNLLKIYHERHELPIYKSKLKDTVDEEFNPQSERGNSKYIKRSGRQKKSNLIQPQSQEIKLAFSSSKKSISVKASAFPLQKRDIFVEDMFVDQSLEGKIVYLVREKGVLFYRDRIWVLERCKEALIKYYQSCVKINDK